MDFATILKIVADLGATGIFAGILFYVLYKFVPEINKNHIKEMTSQRADFEKAFKEARDDFKITLKDQQERFQEMLKDQLNGHQLLATKMVESNDKNTTAINMLTAAILKSKS